MKNQWNHQNIFMQVICKFYNLINISFRNRDEFPEIKKWSIKN